MTTLHLDKFLSGHVFGFLFIFARIGGIFEDVTEAKLSVEHQGVLLNELQHRVRNIMAIVRSIITHTGATARTVPEYTELVEGRLLALARVQSRRGFPTRFTQGLQRQIQKRVISRALASQTERAPALSFGQTRRNGP